MSIASCFEEYFSVFSSVLKSIRPWWPFKVMRKTVLQAFPQSGRNMYLFHVGEGLWEVKREGGNYGSKGEHGNMKGNSDFASFRFKVNDTGRLGEWL